MPTFDGTPSSAALLPARPQRAALLAFTMLAACGDKPADTTVLAKVEEQQRQAAPDDDGRIACALAGADELKRDCTVDRVEGEGGLVLVVRHPDGGFRRLLVTRDGRGVAAADGAERAEVALVDAGEIEVRLGGDVYRLPATVKGAAPK